MQYSTLTTSEVAEYVTFAVDIARSAGELTLKYFQQGTPVEFKADNSPVTIADRRAEELLRSRIEKEFPAHGILGEEFGEQPGSAPARWIIDPIDGTYSFVSGVPLYSNLVALEWADEAIVGVINLPAIGEIVYAGRGLGCKWNDQVCRVSEVQDLSKARLATTSTKLIEQHDRENAYRRLRAACASERGWCDAYGYALVATARTDIMLDPIMSIWDTAALYPVITEAGGALTDWQGTATHTAPEALATNGKLHRAVLDTLAPRS